MESLTIHCGGARLQATPNTFRQTQSYSIHRHYSKKITQRSLQKRKPCLTYKLRENVLITRALNDGNAVDKNEENDSSDNDKTDSLTWNRLSQAFGRGTQRFFHNFSRDLKKETGIDIKVATSKVGETSRELKVAAELYRRKGLESVEKLRFELWPSFVAWNRLELWKDFKKWESKRIGALILYVLVVAVSLGGLYLAFRRPRLDHQTISKLAESYLEEFVPDPSPRNVRKLKKALWRRYLPEGLKVNKYYVGRDESYHQSKYFVGEDAWEDDAEPSEADLRKAIDEDTNFSDEQKEKLKELGVAATGGTRNPETRGTWVERLRKWDKILENEKSKEDVDALTSKYEILFNWEEMKENFEKQQEQERPNTECYRGEWISKRWWQYRPKLPYTYFLLKVECLEVEAVVFSEDLKRIYVTMKEGFPSEYIVDIPVDPYLSELLKRCSVEVDTLPLRSLLSYTLRAAAVIAPGFFIMWLIHTVLFAANVTAQDAIYDILNSKYESMVLPREGEDMPKLGYNDVVLGGDVWDLLDEIMTYLNNPMEYYDKQVKFPRGILISGPPGTGKTLLARAIARESGLPFVFASGSEFTESEGARHLFELFFTARANAPAFIFIDEIDALAGKHAKDDILRRKAFDRLLAELDAEDTFLSRYDPRQAIILICATNRPEELDKRFIRSGRIDREIYLGLPREEERVKIFDVHTAGKRLAKDVNFEKLVFRTVGCSGADIRNLVNECGIMAIRNGHNEICQQDIIDVLDRQLFETLGMVITDEEQRMYERKVPVEKKRLLAVHEAGHILLAHLFPRFDWHAFTFLLPAGKVTALSVFYPREELVQKGYPTEGYLKMHMVVAHGGRCAEELVFGDDNVTDEGQDDLAKISSIARELVISPTHPRLGLFRLTWNDKFETPDYKSDDWSLMPNEWEQPETEIAEMSVELSELFTREVTRYIDETEQKAKIALRENKHIFDRLVAELFERSRLTGLEVEDIVKSMNPVMIDDFLEMPDLNLENKEISKPADRYKDLDIAPAPLHRC